MARPNGNEDSSTENEDSSIENEVYSIKNEDSSIENDDYDDSSIENEFLQYEMKIHTSDELLRNWNLLQNPSFFRHFRVQNSSFVTQSSAHFKSNVHHLCPVRDRFVDARDHQHERQRADSCCQTQTKLSPETTQNYAEVTQNYAEMTQKLRRNYAEMTQKLRRYYAENDKMINTVNRSPG